MADQDTVKVEVPGGTVELHNTPTGAQQGFFFKVQADENGITELTFKKDPAGVFATIFGVVEFVNQSFDVPFPTLGDFFRSLADSADKIQEMHNATEKPGA